MDAKSLLRLALDKITPDQAGELLEHSNIVFGIGGTHVKFVGGHLENSDGQIVDAAMSAITSVETEEEVERRQADLRSRMENSDNPDDEKLVEEARRSEAARFREQSNQQLSTSHTVLGGGQTRVLSPAGSGINVVGGENTGDQFGKQENIATNGFGTGAGFVNANQTPGGNLPQETVPNQQGERRFQTDANRGVQTEGENKGEVDPEYAARVQREMVEKSERESQQKGAATQQPGENTDAASQTTGVQENPGK